MAYKHGIGINENPTQLTKPKEGTSGIQVVIGTAPINTLNNPGDAVNKPVVARSFDDVVDKLGYSDDFEQYTLSQSAFASFKHYNVAPVVFINVLDPEIHKEDVTEKEFPVKNRQIIIEEKGMLLAELVVKNVDVELKEGTDYVATFDSDGNVIITILSTGSAATVSKLKVGGVKIDPSKVTEQDIVGGYDALTGKEKGIECIRQVFPRTGLVPGILLAPGWSKNKNVGAALIAKTVAINGLFKAFAVIDISTANATKYEDVEREKDECGFNDENSAVLWPMLAIGKRKLAYSAVYAAKLSLNDKENGDIVDITSSNQDLEVTAAILEDGTEVLLDETQANELNAAGIVTVNNFGGKIYSWGNNTAAYPNTEDVKDKRIGCRRFFSWWGNSFIMDYHKYVDKPGNIKLIEALVDAENIKGNSYAAQGKCAGAAISFDYEKNTTEKIIEGNIEFTQKLAPYTPMEYIQNTLEFDPTMISTAFGGGK